MSRPLKLSLIIGGSLLAGMLLMLTVAIGLGWYWTDGPGAQSSVAQQQQEWEQEIEERHCEVIGTMSPGDLELRWALDDGRGFDAHRMMNGQPGRTMDYNCHDQAWQRYITETVERRFEESPAWDAGETFATWYGR